MRAIPTTPLLLGLAGLMATGNISAFFMHPERPFLLKTTPPSKQTSAGQMEPVSHVERA